MAILEKKQSNNNGVDIDLMNARAHTLKNVMQGNAKEKTPMTENPSKETNITFRVTEQEKTTYKSFFVQKNISLSFGIKLAIEHLINDVNAGRGTIKKTGYFEQ